MKFDRSMHADTRGAAAVGQLTEVSAWEAELILNLRLWQDGERGRRAVWEAYAAAFGPRDGRAALDRFVGLLTVIEGNMLRPLVRHGVACGCVGSDEAVLANMVRMAAEGELHEASLIATLMVRPAHAEQVALMAADVGSTLRTLVARHRPARDRLHGKSPRRLH
jgi:hypothetical protein